ncbi:MAG TPA: peptide chain release factor N(5)-glutamine methyltransferase [Acidisarcina sp.]
MSTDEGGAAGLNVEHSIGSLLREGRERLQKLSSGRRDAELLLMRAADLSRSTVLTSGKQRLSPEIIEGYRRMVERRAAFEPVQYILGEQEFFGLRFEVTRDVLIPRPETEHLVEALLARMPRDRAVRIADVGTGSGAIAVALARELPQAELTALDISPEALLVAVRNAEQHGVGRRVRFALSDLLQAVCEGPAFDAIVSNPPYIGDGEALERQVRDHEPRAALFGGETGFEVYERLIPQAAALLRPGGWLLLEIGASQQERLRELLAVWDEVSFVRDLQGIPRVAVARLAAAQVRVDQQGQA